MFKYFMAFYLVINLSINAFAGASLKLADLMLSGSGIGKILNKNGIIGNDAKQIESYMASSLSVFGSSKSLTKKELTDALVKLPMGGSDASVRKELQILLDTPENEIKKEHIVKAINNIIYLANRYGNAVIITCAECVNENLAKHGFKFTVENIKSASSVKILTEVIPDNPGDLDRFIANRMTRFGMGEKIYDPHLVAPYELKSLALFLGLAESGTADQKALIAAIKKVSTRNGKTNIVDPKNPHKFWKIFSDDMSPQDMSNWTKALNELAALQEKENILTEKGFYRLLKEKAEGDENLMEQYKTLKSKRCFFH